MVSGEGNENSQKTSKSNEPERTLHVQHTFFFHRRHKIFMLFFQRHWSPLFFISRSSSFSVIHVNVEINKVKSKEKIGFAVVIFLSLKVRVAMPCNTKTRGYLKCKFQSAYIMKGVDIRTDVRKIF